ncbi:hypothetical protein C5167_037495 [Papaver somniferum]|uniref:IBB domain-containing protein n=1 Tax=Papaver somniferum TaxID=3469 RepID=A0A4Y7I6V3_PAPSO|nr:hypothetical protein C5167_037495 [Papaver somniferum]
MILIFEQFEVALALMNIASGTSENTEVVIEQGAIPIFVALLSSPSDDVRDQTKPALPALKRLINSTDEVLTDSCWALSYMTVQMKTKLLLRLVHVTDLLSYCCKYHFISPISYCTHSILLLEMIVIPSSFPTDIIRLDEDIMSPLAGRRSNFILMRGYISGNTSKLLDRPICK